MSRHRRGHLGRRITRRLLILSRKTVCFLHLSRSRAVLTNGSGQRFSLISLADFQATLSAQRASLLRRERMFPVQISGFHVVCAECEGFVVRNGLLRSCRHQRDSGSSSISGKSGEIRGEGADESGARASDDDWRKYKEIALVRPKTGGDGRVVKAKVRGPVLAVNHRVAEAYLNNKDTVRSGTPVASSSLHLPFTTAADNVPDLTLRTGDFARARRFCRKTETGVSFSSDEDMMTEAEVSVDGDWIYQTHYDAEALMRDWREWLQRWERLVKSR